ncbi:hypothetical protein F6455_10445 [Proteobacteria bacterium 005FR1]|nr:hypothetical protein [Proteobacteria bacterium 005FR1]
MKRWLIVLLPLIATGCGPVEPRFHSENAIPERLDDWGMVYRDGDSLRWSEAVEVYDLTTPLFTDYAHKLRTVHVPEGGTISRDSHGRLQYPVGTVFSKTFYYPAGNSARQVKKTDFAEADLRDGLSLTSNRVLETRLLVHYDSGWKALSYVWNEDQSEARRKITGALFPLTLVDGAGEKQDFHYVVPDANQCAGCHATTFANRQAEPIGPARPDFINRDSPLGSGNQLQNWQQRGWLSADHQDWPRAADWQDPSASLPDRARAYLDINCAHCHSETGAGDTSGLWLNRTLTASRSHLGICKPPIAAGQGTGGRRWGIAPGHPDDSILIYRMASRDPGAMMPELGRSLVHEEGVALIRTWISGLEGSCTRQLTAE